MPDPTPTNPFRDGLSSARQTPEPCSIVIFGATGDLTHRKLIPALYNLLEDGDLPADTQIVGFARRDVFVLLKISERRQRNVAFRVPWRVTA